MRCLQNQGISVVGHIKRGLPPVTLQWWAPVADLPSMLQVITLQQQAELASLLPPRSHCMWLCCHVAL